MKRIVASVLAVTVFQFGSVRTFSQNVVRASIEGSVLQAGSNQPIANVEITLFKSSVPSTTIVQPGSPTSSVETVVMTDGAGKFLFRELVPGSYQLVAARNGFSRQEYGQKSAFHAGQLINLSSGQNLRDLVIHLIPTGTVTGRVSDTNGLPLQGMNVQLLRIAYDSDGRRLLRPTAGAVTNDLGEFRLYWITPGRYLLNADPSRSTLEMQLRNRSSGVVAGTPGAQVQIDALRGKNEVVDDAYVTTYYPGVADSSRAEAVEVRSGGELPGIRITVPRLQRFRVTGHLVDAATGSAAGRSGSVTLRPSDPLAPSLSTSSFDAMTGAFEVRNVPPGNYVLEATMLAPNPATTPSSTVRSRIVVNDRDLDEVIAIRYGTAVSGRVDVEGVASGTTLPVSERIIVGLATLSMPSSIAGTKTAKVAPNGTFTIENVPAGEYGLRFTGLPPDDFVKTAWMGIKDTLREPVAVGVTSPEAIVITVGRKAGQVSGEVMDRNQVAVAGIPVLLIPDMERERHDLYKSAVSDSTGHFAIRGIAPGDYKIFAWEDLEPYSWFDPEVLQKFESLGRAVHIVEGSNISVRATIIP